jgi:hypothetical protein
MSALAGSGPPEVQLRPGAAARVQLEVCSVGVVTLRPAQPEATGCLPVLLLPPLLQSASAGLAGVGPALPGPAPC